MSLYHWINLFSISVPFLAGFHPRIKLYQRWPALFLAIVVTMVPFIIWDVYFTAHGYWGFNPLYLSGLMIFHLPIEEWLFFVCIPYACVFTHLSVLELNPKLELSDKVTKVVSLALLIIMSLLLVFNFDKAYTSLDMIFALVALILVYKLDFSLLKNFFITFLFMLIPFFIVNGVLTGTGIEQEVVWYNDQENLSIRILTIPIEDTAYAFSMILMNLFLFRKFNTFFKQ